MKTQHPGLCVVTPILILWPPHAPHSSLQLPLPPEHNMHKNPEVLPAVTIAGQGGALSSSEDARFLGSSEPFSSHCSPPSSSKQLLHIRRFKWYLWTVPFSNPPVGELLRGNQQPRTQRFCVEGSCQARESEAYWGYFWYWAVLEKGWFVVGIFYF